MQRERKLALLAGAGILLATLIWGVSFVIVKNTVDTVPPMYMIAIRFTMATVGMVLVCFKRLRSLNKRLLLGGAIVGCALFAGMAFQTMGIRYTTAGKNAFLTTSYVVLVPFMNWLLLKRKPDKLCLLAALLAVVGIGLLSLNGDWNMNLGDALTLACGVGYGLHIVLATKYGEKQDMLLLTLVQFATTAALGWCLAPLLDGAFPVAAFEPEMIGSMLYIGVLSTMVGLLLQNIGHKYVKPAPAAVILSLESVFGVLFSCLFLHEQLTLRMLLGCALMFLAVLLSQVGPSIFSRGRQKPGLPLEEAKPPRDNN